MALEVRVNTQDLANGFRSLKDNPDFATDEITSLILDYFAYRFQESDDTVDPIGFQIRINLFKAELARGLRGEPKGPLPTGYERATKLPQAVYTLSTVPRRVKKMLNAMGHNEFADAYEEMRKKEYK